MQSSSSSSSSGKGERHKSPASEQPASASILPLVSRVCWQSLCPVGKCRVCSPIWLPGDWLGLGWQAHVATRMLLPHGKFRSHIWSTRMDPTERALVPGTSAQQHGVGTWDLSSEGAAALIAVPSPANTAPSASTTARVTLTEDVCPTNINYIILALCPHFLHAVTHHLLSSIPPYKQKLSWVDRGVLDPIGGWCGSCRTSHLCSCPGVLNLLLMDLHRVEKSFPQIFLQSKSM